MATYYTPASATSTTAASASAAAAAAVFRDCSDGLWFLSPVTYISKRIQTCFMFMLSNSQLCASSYDFIASVHLSNIHCWPSLWTSLPCAYTHVVVHLVCCCIMPQSDKRVMAVARIQQESSI